ncbi:MAG: phosphoribosylformylglycinamidine synthase, partial [Candidatus Glassbacteria bacterium]|nr:phosphoribosylformylglycinamidine synthase [Candidatus Glassbacteria bacterium]
GLFRVFFEGRAVGALEMEFLHEGLPRMKLEARWQQPEFPDPVLPGPGISLNETLLALLERYNVCSKESHVRQYDHEVQAATLVKPFTGSRNDGPSDAAVVRPLPESNRGLAVGCGIIPRYSDLDTYHMAACCLDEALRNVVAVGARPDRVAVLDNFCWPDPVQSDKTPDGTYKLAQLVRACQALYDYCTAFGVPLISGKDSMKNDYGSGPEKISVPPTLLITALGIIDDVNRAVTMDVKRAGDLVYVVGESFEECGGSEYFALLGAVGKRVPRVDAARSHEVFTALHGAISRGLVASCHDISDGGLGVALAESALAGDLGMVIDLALVPGAEHFERDDLLLFSESQGRFVVTVQPELRSEFEEIISTVPCALVGMVAENPVLTVHSIRTGEAEIISVRVDLLRVAWQNPLAW